MAENEILLDVGQVAERLNMSIATVRRWVWQGYIPFMKIGKAIRFSKSDIDNWVSAKCTNPKKQEGVQNVGIA